MAGQYDEYIAAGAFGDAFKNAIQAWQDGQDRDMKKLELQSRLDAQKAEKERNSFLDQMTMREKNLQKGPDGQIVRDPYAQREADIIKLAPHGLRGKYDEQGRLIDTEYDQAYLNMQEQKANADPYGLKGLQVKNAQAELQKKQLEAQQASRGFKLPPDKVLQVQQGAQIPTIMGDIEQTLAANKDAFGPVAGRLGQHNPYNERSQSIDAQVRSASQSFGRYMEGGVLRKEDEEKYRKMFPQLTDTPEVAANKLAIVRKQLVDKQNADIAALKDQGYDITGFKFLPPTESPGILKGGMLKNGLLKSGAHASPATKPKTVIQNGITYTLNPQTGEYE